MALSANSPIYRGYLADVDARWNVISSSVDDRTPEERGLKVKYGKLSFVPICIISNPIFESLFKMIVLSSTNLVMIPSTPIYQTTQHIRPNMTILIWFMIMIFTTS